MATYGGFAPGTYQGWALNLIYNVFGTAGIARGLQVTAPGGMLVSVGLDSVAADGVCYLSNGSFVRIDAALTFSVPNNGTGGTRTDAVVAFCDPTGLGGSPSVTYVTNWATSFTPGTNQFVIALVSVPNGTGSITSGNITMNSATAKLGNAGGGASNSMVASDGIGLSVQDNSATSTLSVVTTGLTNGVGRIVAIVATDASQIGHVFTFGTDGSLGVPGSNVILNPVALNGEGASTVMLQASSGGASGRADVHFRNPTGGWTYFNQKNGSSYVDDVGSFSGNANSVTYEKVIDTSNNTTSLQRIFTGTVQPTNATNGDIWINA